MIRRIRAHRGDIIAFNNLGEGNTVDHLAIVSGVTSNGTVLISSHDTDRADDPWSEAVDSSNGSQGAYGSGWIIHRYRVSRGRF